MNVECTDEGLEELTTNFRYNDAVLRNLVIRMDAPVSEESPILKAENESRERRAARSDRPRREESTEAKTEEVAAPAEAPAADAGEE